MSIKAECAAAKAAELVAFDSAYPCKKCGGTRRYANQGQCAACAARRDVNKRAKLMQEKGPCIGKPRRSESALALAVGEYVNGLGLVEAASRFNVGVARLRGRLEAMGVFRSLGNIKLERALEMVRAGTPVAVAAAKCFVLAAAIERVLIAEGVIDAPSSEDPELLESARCVRALKAFPSPKRAA